MSSKSQNKSKQVEQLALKLGSFNYQMIEASPSGTVLVDAQADDMPVVYVNASFQELTGYSWDEVIGKNCRFLQGDDQDQPDLDILRHAIENEQTCFVTLRNYRKDGSLFWNELRISPIFDDDDQLIYFIGIQNDVTERKQASDYLQATLNSSLNGIMAFESVRDDLGKIIDFRWTQVNHQAEQMVGYLRADLLGKHLLEEMPGNQEDGLFDLYVKVVESGQPLDHEHYYEHEKVKTWLHTTAVKLNDGFVVTFTDITQRKQIEENIQKTNAILQHVFDNTHFLLAYLDAEFNFVQVNKKYALADNKTPEELVGKNHFDLYPNPENEAIFRQVVETGESVTFQAKPFKYPEHPEFGVAYWDWSLHPVQDHGEILGLILILLDVTERKKSEQLLFQHEQRLRMTLQGTRAGMWEWNIQTGETVFNERWAEIIGYTLDELTPTSIQTWIDLTHPDDLQRSDQLLKQHFAGEVDYYECEARMKHKDGHWIWVLDRGTVMEWDTDGKPLRMFGTHIDITERKHADVALRESETRYRILAHNVTDMIATHDLNGVYTFVSPSCESLLGYTPEELIGHSAYELFHSDDLAAIRKSHQTIQVTSDRYTVQYRIQHKAGHYVWFETTSQVVRHKITRRPRMIITVSRDVSERVQMEEAIHQSEREFRNLTEKSPDLIVRIERDSTHLYANPAFAKAIGLPAEEIIGKTNTDLGVPDEVEHQFAAIRNQIYETGKSATTELNYPVDGITRHFHLRLTPELDTEGNVKSIISVSRDITERKQVIQREFELSLERERRRLLTSFIQNAAHEFRTPLTTINASAYIMSRLDDGTKRVQKLAQVENHIRRITKLLDMQLMMAKLENNQALSTASVNISDVIAEIWQEMKRDYGRTHVMRQEVLPNLPAVSGNADYLAEALKQIIENACRFTPIGGSITLSAQTVGKQIHIEIQDTGVGISDDELPHIFKTFWRQDTAHSTPGFGLGLPIAQKIIEQHGGEITVEQVQSGGSRFCIVLPF